MFDVDGRFTVVGEFVDDESASSGARRDRPGWAELWRAVRSGQVLAVGFWRLDRLGRVAAEVLRFVAECSELGVELCSFSDSDRDLQRAKLAVGLKALFAEAEAEVISQRQLAAKRHAAQAGFFPGGRVPFGWRRSRDKVADASGRLGYRLEADPVPFAALRRGVELVASGASLAQVGRMWADRFGVVAADGGPVAAGSLWSMLTSPRLLGYRMAPSGASGTLRGSGLLAGVALDADGAPVLGHPAVCDEVTWLTARSRLAGRGTARRRRWGSTPWLLAGLLVCTGCGSTLVGRRRQATASGPGRAFYGCQSHARRGGQGPAVSIGAEPVQEFVTGWLLTYLSAQRLADARAALDSRLVAAGRYVAEQVALVEQELDVLNASAMGSEAGSRIAVQMIGNAAARRERMLERLGAADDSAADTLAGVDELAGRWPEMSLTARRDVLRRVIDRIEVSPGRGRVASRVAVRTRF